MDTTKNVDKYLSRFPKDTQEKLKKIRQIICEEIPGAEETISYGVPTFKLNGKYVVYLAGFKSHLSIYPASDGMVTTIKDAAEYRKGKGTLQFSLDKPLPLLLIRQVVKYLVKEHKARGKK